MSEAPISEAPTLATPRPAAPRAGANELARNHVTIDGVSLGLDEIVNAEFFAPARVEALRETFVNAKPVPHVVVDGLFAPALLDLVYADFDRLNWSDWRRYDNAKEFKRGSAPKTWLGHASHLYFSTIHSGRFVDFLERVTGIEGLIADPGLSAAGLHDIPTGGKFAMHIDFNQHSVTRLDNRLMFITYLNKNWRSSYGGALELWDMDENKFVAEVVPEFGRSVLYYHSAKSLHGHPKPISEPNGPPAPVGRRLFLQRRPSRRRRVGLSYDAVPQDRRFGGA
ncbi:2OG-Fe(II) oxygenase [Methylocella sp.]|uniref:2OG-Fe(II) oxygenase n=1 Tax=Methylocella sp. TaxID=1978226 RepID=UPI003C1F4AE3